VNTTQFYGQPTTFTTSGVFTTSLTTTLSDGKTTVFPTTLTGTLTLTIPVTTTTSNNPRFVIGCFACQQRLIRAPSSLTPSGDPSASRNQTGVTVGGVVGATGVIILGLIIFFVLRHKRRYKASRLESAGDGSTSSNVPGQCIPQSARLSTTPRPFLDFPMMENHPPTKGVATDRTGILPAQNSSGEIASENPFRDPVLTESNNEGEGQRVRNALDNLQALTSRFEGELLQLGALTQSGQLSAEDRLKLEEIRRTTGLTIQFDSRRGRFSVVRSASSGSSFSLNPPSYHTRGGEA
jgi:hypothetical protein